MSFNTIAAARQNETNASIAVVAIRTRGSAAFGTGADSDDFETWFMGMSK